MKIAISGTYSTGKTTTSIALSLLTGIPVTHARTMREILPAAIPGKRLEECGFHELIELGVRRFSERVIAEQKIGSSFVSDGCPLQEWLYGTTRMSTGLNPTESPEKIRMHKLLYATEWEVFEETIMALGKTVKEYTKHHYDLIIHLPVEFPFNPDGHRPTSELFRQKSEELLIRTYEELELQVVEFKGSISSRLEAILRYLRIEPVMPVDEAINIAQKTKRERFDNVKIEYGLGGQPGLSTGENLLPIHRVNSSERIKKERKGNANIQYLEKEMLFKTKNKAESIPYNDIKIVLSDKPYIRLETISGRKYHFNQTIEEFYVGLPPCFIQFDKSGIVNLLHASGFKKNGTGCQMAINGDIFQVAKRRKKEVEVRFMKIKQETGGGGICGKCNLCQMSN
jgi:Response regulator of the LytR/AlgR family